VEYAGYNIGYEVVHGYRQHLPVIVKSADTSRWEWFSSVQLSSIRDTRLSNDVGSEGSTRYCAEVVEEQKSRRM